MSSTVKAMELKGRMLSVTRARLVSPDTTAAAHQLAELARKMPQALRGMPVVIDSDLDVDLLALLEALRDVGMQPLGVSDGPLAKAARTLGLAILSKDTGKSTHRMSDDIGPPEVVPEPDSSRRRAAARIVSEPVRSGQQVYAEGGDLIILNSVSAGAEVIADGCVHIYGRLSGRAIAGAQGDESARIFCRKLEAELIAISGIYAVSEQIKEGPRGSPAMAYLDHGRLMIEAHRI